MRVQLSVGLGLAALLVAACGSSADSLADTSWQVETLRRTGESLIQPLPGTVLSADFSSDEISGLSGCNTFRGGYTTDGDAFGASALATTRRACSPDLVMDQETVYLSLVSLADRWERDGDQLELLRGTEPLIQFRIAEPTELAGSSWSLLAYNNQAEALVSVVSGTEVTMAFDDGKVTGSAGCNSFGADYEADAVSLKIGPAASTERACLEPAGVMEQELLFLGNLGLVATYEISADGILLMFDEAGTRLLQFVAQ